MTKKTTKRSLAMSILSLVLCLAMLIGSTYAWFSDEAKTGGVTITAGNLKVGIQKASDSSDLEGKALPFKGAPEAGPDGTVTISDWEPGKMYVSDEFEIVNKGNLALKYDFNTAVNDSKTSTVGDETVKLSDVVKVLVVPTSDLGESYTTIKEKSDATLAERQTLWAKAEEVSKTEKSENEIITEGNKSEALVAILFWKPAESTLVYDNSTDPGEEAKKDNPDNLYNFKGEEAPKLAMSFTLNVVATQAPSESDSFGTDYDKDIPLTVAQ